MDQIKIDTHVGSINWLLLKYVRTYTVINVLNQQPLNTSMNNCATHSADMYTHFLQSFTCTYYICQDTSIHTCTYVRYVLCTKICMYIRTWALSVHESIMERQPSFQLLCPLLDIYCECTYQIIELQVHGWQIQFCL